MSCPCGDKPRNAYQLFDQIAARTPAGSGRVIFLPWIYGERAPVDDHFVRGGFYNQSLETTREHMVRAVFEGVAFNSRWLLKYVEQFNGRRAEAVNMVGGGAKIGDLVPDPRGRHGPSDPPDEGSHRGQRARRGLAGLRRAGLSSATMRSASHVPVAKTFHAPA